MTGKRVPQAVKMKDGILHRYCPGCQRWKPLDTNNFYLTTNATTGAQSYVRYCQECVKERSKKRYQGLVQAKRQLEEQEEQNA